jgi:hypothetical protein
MLKVISVLLLVLLAGCAEDEANLTRRNEGKIYKGLIWARSGNGEVTIDVDGHLYTGPIRYTVPGEDFEIVQQYGYPPLEIHTINGQINFTGTLTSNEDKSLRCEFSATPKGGGGICIDDKKMIYDVVVTK